MQDKRQIRQEIDLFMIPSLYTAYGAAFVNQQFLMRPADLLSEIFNLAYQQIPLLPGQKMPVFSSADFGVHRQDTDDVHIVYVTVPPVSDGSALYALAYALTVTEEKTSLYAVMRDNTGDLFFAYLNENGQYLSAGEADEDMDINITLLIHTDPDEDCVDVSDEEPDDLIF